MTPETKEMREDIRKSTGMIETETGKVVAIQYPEKWEYSENEESAGVIAQKYAHFKTLGPDDTDGYKELVAAIADVRTRRTDVGKQEKVIKDPLNKFRDVVIKTSKHIRGLLGKTEDDLKLVKTRIDDIKLERKLALQKTWQANISGLTSILQTMGTMDASQLTELLESQNTYVFKPDDFGEFIDQAKSAVAQNVIAITERIDFLAEQKRLADEKAAFEIKQAEEAAERKRLDDERRAKQEKEQRERDAQAAKDKRIRDDEKAEADRKQAETDAENQRLRDQIAAMEKENEPEPEPVFSEKPDSEGVWLDEAGDIDAGKFDDLHMCNTTGRSTAIEQEPESTVVREEPKQEEQAENFDAIILSAWANEINKARGSLSGFVLSPKAKNAVSAVSDQLSTISEYLDNVAESLK